MEHIEEWIAWRAGEDDRLYEVYGKALEKEHKGEFVAIGPDGETILGANNLALTKQASERFGRGQYAFRRIGYGYEFKIRALRE